jgi:hypothetical protein
MVPVGTIEQSLLYLPGYFLGLATDLICFRSVKRLTERVANIEQYLRSASDRDRPQHISPKFKEARQPSVDDSDGSKGNDILFHPTYID